MSSAVNATQTAAGAAATGTLDPIQAARAAEDNTTLFIAVVCVAWGLAVFTALLRFYTRAVLVRSFGKDDVFMVFAVLFGIGGFVSWVLCCKNGYGRHQDLIPRNEMVVLLEAQFYESVLEASFAFGCLKISIALSLLRLNKGGTWYKWILWTLIGFTCLYTLFAFITFMTFCKPISGQWDRTTKPKCYNKELYRDFGLFNAACNITTDIMFATLPIPLIWSLQLQRRIRIYLIAILSGGYFAVALGITKAIFIIAFVHERDGTYFPGAPFFGALQLDMGIIAACAPTLRPLLGTVLKLSTHLNHYREANYYRAGKALDRLPVSGNSTKGYLRQQTASGQFVELGLGSPKPQKWANINRGNSGFIAVVHNNQLQRDEDILAEKSDDDAIMQVPTDPDFKGIVKTTEFKVEK
ncbi:hypothetical protein QBC47DRAFT_430913 [Echria macrotheca]|uniref:Rhodopsin domain-containing protein n=1 Tax=Echria macrotheca TaxID=438768 RepID=A0AAJ0B7A6_9PEZI|nr:hypothetical protein QBC47DRAFT_430913 [Echria macrotheca]